MGPCRDHNVDNNFDAICLPHLITTSRVFGCDSIVIKSLVQITKEHLSCVCNTFNKV